MSGSPIPDVRHSAPFIEIIRSNYSDFAAYQDATTVVYPVLLSPLEYRNLSIISETNSSVVNSTREINSFYFYKVFEKLNNLNFLNIII